jgi:hypothetical protein
MASNQNFLNVSKSSIFTGKTGGITEDPIKSLAMDKVMKSATYDNKNTAKTSAISTSIDTIHKKNI